MVFSFLNSRLQLWSRAPIMFQWLVKNEPAGKPCCIDMPTTSPPPSTPPSSSGSSWTPFLQDLGRIIVVSFLSGMVLRILEVFVFQRGRRRRVAAAYSSTRPSVAWQVGEKIISFLIFTIIVKFRLGLVGFVRSLIVSKEFFYLTFGGSQWATQKEVKWMYKINESNDQSVNECQSLHR